MTLAFHTYFLFYVFPLPKKKKKALVEDTKCSHEHRFHNFHPPYKGELLKMSTLLNTTV